MIFITGATGRLGKEVLKIIPNAIPLVRTPTGLRNEIITSFEKEELKKVLKSADCVIHLAGSMNFLDLNELREVNIELTKRVAAALPKKCRIIFASSISVYGKLILHVPANEETPLNPDSPYAKSKADAEEIVKKCNDYVILRIATIYGKGFDDYYEILRQIKNNKMRIIGHGQNRIPFVHVEDVAYAIKNSLKTEKGIYVLSGEALKQVEILQLSASLLGVSEIMESIPLDAALMFAKFEESKAMLMKQKPKITTEHILILASDRPFDCTKARKKLGFKPRSLKLGLIEVIEDGHALGIF